MVVSSPLTDTKKEVSFVSCMINEASVFIIFYIYTVISYHYRCNNNGGDEEEDMESDNDCDAERCNNNGEDEEKYTKSDDDCDTSKSSDASKNDNEEIDP